ncbi:MULTISPECIES: response regulator transcription factor [Sulfurospirillum]|uniref:Response regulator transcription factor n=5 Tax=Sulfurospirillum TaxID=57665 RepID=A0A1Y0HN10_9BACT|nr:MULTISPECIES: response regulator transcription factor [Sulfurospirillum]AHJ12795.1 two-component response regulator [Sulfurospirillum multivorans DSM 12446]AOO65274.1 two-component response regulator [Sulfurospirillum halorespirans DSM 13726]ARU48754.1 two-component response regulator [Sulfurospirillum diekertiae]ATB69617.1 two-component response regulator [Sulfurospirillum diekertiae]QEH06290.1 two-component response regulator [Sulfurospirillum multivorans]
MLASYTILYADDEEQTRENIGEILSLFCKKVYLAKDGKEALQIFQNNTIDIAIFDIEMPYFNGLEVCEQIREFNQKIPLVIATAYTDTEYFLKAVELNLAAYILKPVTAIDLKNALKKCVANLKNNKNEKIYFSDIVYYDTIKRALFVNEKDVILRRSEITFLEYLLKRVNEIVSYQEFENNIWEEGMSSAAIRSLVRDIRKHLPPETIINVARLGYKLKLYK